MTAGRIEFPNGSRILLGGFLYEKDIEKYLGIEYDVIVIEECTQISETKKDKIRGSLRTSKPDWKPRIYLDTNADGIGLQWFKRMFVVPWRMGDQRLTRFFDVSGIYNPFTNPEYEAWLDTLTGPLRKAWKEGDWDAFAGMAFPTWRHDRHVCSPFEIPADWPKWRAVDWGKAKPFCAHWITREPDTRRLYWYHEVYGAGFTDNRPT
jgi:phage terminase large subunit